MAELAVAPYDDGSSTESEYYFDPAEKAAGEAAFAWVHEHDASVKQEPLNQPKPQRHEDNTAIKEECNGYRPGIEELGEIALPQGSEWSHGATSTVCDDAVEQSLAMARELSKAQREEALTADTMNSNASPIEKKEEGEKQERKRVSLKKKKEAKKSKSKVVGLRRPSRKVVGEPSELEKGLSVARSHWKSTGSQSSSSQKTSPSHVKTSPPKKSEESKFPPRKRSEHCDLPSVRRTEAEKVSSSRRVEHGSRTGRNRSPVTHYSRRSRSRTPPSRRVEERRKRSRSRSPYRASTAASPRSRSHRVGESVSSPRHHYDSEKRSSRTYERSRSPPRSSRSFQSARGHHKTKSRSRSRSRSRGRERERERYDHHEFRRSHYDSNELRSTQQISGKRDSNPRSPSHCEFVSKSRGTQQTNRDIAQHRSRDCQRSGREIPLHDMEKWIPSLRNDHKIKSRSDETSRGTSFRLNADRSASKPRLQESEPLRPRRPKEVSYTVNTNVVKTTKRSPRGPHIRPRVEASTASRCDSMNSSYVYHDPFKRRVFKLKLQEADIDEKMAAGPLDGSDKWFYENRKRGIAAERARLMTEDLERFEKVYASSTVTPFELKRYQGDRDFAWRVVQFKRKQASLQEQNGSLVSSEAKIEVWRRLDEEREKLISENASMFHKVMMSQDQAEGTFKLRERNTFATSANAPQHSGKRVLRAGVRQGQPKRKRRASGVAPTTQSYSPANSRVVVGAALQLQGDSIHNNSFDPLRSRPSNTPWFLKG